MTYSPKTTILLIMRAETHAERRRMMISLKYGAGTSGFVLPFGIIRTSALISLFVILILNASPVYSNAPICNPTGATLCAAVDDNSDIYLNGTLLDTFTYCDITWTCTPKCISLSPAQLALLTDGDNVISVYTQNTNCCEVWASWYLDITCASGRVQISSDNRPVLLYSDTTCETVPTPNPSPTPAGGKQWFDPLYVPNVAWVTPTDMTGFKYGKRIYDPSTGDLLASLSYIATMSTGCGALWFREGFQLTPAPTPLPPVFTITKSADQSGITGNQKISFTLNICNTGGGTMGLPLVVQDDWLDSAPEDVQFGGPYGDYMDTNLGLISENHGTSRRLTITFQNGFSMNSCYNYVYWLNYNTNPAALCKVWHNNSDILFAMTGTPTPGPYSTVTLKNFCPSSTITKTVTATPTFTMTLSPTATATPTVTNTPLPLSIQLIKTEDKTIVMLGDNVQYCLNYTNTGTSPATFNVWDTIPAPMDFVSCTCTCTGGCGPVGNLVVWTITNLGAGLSGSACFTVKAARLPYLMKMDEYLAWIFDRKRILSDCGRGSPLLLE